MDRRLIIFLVVSFLILTLYPYAMNRFIGRRDGPQRPERPQQTPSGRSAGGLSSLAASPVQTIPGGPANTAAAEPQAPAPQGRQGRIITVETPLYRLLLATQGATIAAWELKQYTTTTGGPSVQLLASEVRGPRPLALLVGPAGAMDGAFERGVYTVSGGDAFVSDRLILSAGRPSATLIFTLEDPATKARAEKRLTFHHHDYLVDVEVAVTSEQPRYALALGTNFGILAWSSMTGHAGPLTAAGDAIKKHRVDKLVTEEAIPGPIRWTAIQDRYFISALIPMPGTEPQQVVIKKEGPQQISATVHGTRAGRYTLYAGPKNYARLQALGVGLEESVDFGWFLWDSWTLVRLAAKPLFYLMTAINSATKNYGLTIIVLTIMIRAAFIPVAHKSYRSFKNMQEIQPKLAVLQKKYKDDKPRLNQEMMALYKLHGVNPFGGCLPVLLQMPVFVSFFNILSSTIELRQAPFTWWITDLSAKDPYYVLPIIMGLTMLLQQRMQPTADPKQAQMMMFMPAIFTVMFLKFPSGLVLYWMVNNLLAMLQQYITMKYLEPRGVTA